MSIWLIYIFIAKDMVYEIYLYKSKDLCIHSGSTMYMEGNVYKYILEGDQKKRVQWETFYVLGFTFV